MSRSMFFAALLGLLPSFATADDEATPVAEPVPAPRSAVALIDMAEVFKQSKRFQRETEELKGRVAEVSAQMKTMVAMGKGLQEGLKAAESLEERKQFERDVLKVKAELETLQTLTQTNLAREEAAIYRGVYEDVLGITKELARERGFTMVLRYQPVEHEEGDTPKETVKKLNQLVVFAEPHHDITDEVIARLNASRRSTTSGDR